MPIIYQWRGDFANAEVDALHAAAFPGAHDERNWQGRVARHTLGWVVARSDRDLVGFVNVPWDGLAHAWIQDTMVAPERRRQRIGTQLIALARDASRDAGCAWLHVDFDDDLATFYFEACGFTPTSAGIISLA